MPPPLPPFPVSVDLSSSLLSLSSSKLEDLRSSFGWWDPLCHRRQSPGQSTLQMEEDRERMGTSSFQARLPFFHKLLLPSFAEPLYTSINNVHSMPLVHQGTRYVVAQLFPIKIVIYFGIREILLAENIPFSSPTLVVKKNFWNLRTRKGGRQRTTHKQAAK